MAHDNLQSVLNVNTQVRCKKRNVMYISVKKITNNTYFARGCAYNSACLVAISLLYLRTDSRRQLNNSSILYYFVKFTKSY